MHCSPGLFARWLPCLAQLVPVLLRNMVYDEFDEEVADAEAAEHPGLSQNSDAEVRPFIHRCNAAGCSAGQSPAGRRSGWNGMRIWVDWQSDDWVCRVSNPGIEVQRRVSYPYCTASQCWFPCLLITGDPVSKAAVHVSGKCSSCGCN